VVAGGVGDGVVVVGEGDGLGEGDVGVGVGEGVWDGRGVCAGAVFPWAGPTRFGVCT